MGGRGASLNAAGRAQIAAKQVDKLSAIRNRVEQASIAAGYGGSTGIWRGNTSDYTFGNDLVVRILDSPTGEGQIPFKVNRRGSTIEITNYLNSSGDNIGLGAKPPYFTRTMSPLNQVRSILNELGENYTVSVRNVDSTGSRGYTGPTGRQQRSSENVSKVLIFKKQN